MRIFLQTPYSGDRPPRFYHLFLQEDLLEGWTLVKEWGFQGSPGRIVRQHYASQEEALEAMLASRDQQINRGYLVMFTEGQGLPR